VDKMATGLGKSKVEDAVAESDEDSGGWSEREEAGPAPARAPHPLPSELWPPAPDLAIEFRFGRNGLFQMSADGGKHWTGMSGAWPELAALEEDDVQLAALLKGHAFAATEQELVRAVDELDGSFSLLEREVKARQERHKQSVAS
jgi:hypothetical protein